MKTDQRFRDRVEAATVRLTKLRGQGVLVPGGFILTATHCIDWSGDGAMPLGDFFLEPVRTRDGRKFRAQVYAAEPVADIAALGAADSHSLWDDSLDFDEFVEAIQPVALYPEVPPLEKPLPAQVLTHKGKWIAGTVTRYGAPFGLPSGIVWFRADGQIVGGTSGGPVVDRFGRLLGIVSQGTSLTKGTPITTEPVRMPLPWLALPRWLLDKIMAGSKRATARRR